MITLEDLTTAYLKARVNKRRSRDSVRFEVDYESNLCKLLDEINNRTFKADSNYAFVVTYPKPREIFATQMATRVIHHYLDWRLRPIYEKVLSERSFNNRKGLGLHKAIDVFRQDVAELTEDYTKDAWIVHLDLKGFFPNANVEIALGQQLDLIEKYYEGEDKDDLKYMMTTCMRADPARHCDIYVPKENWDIIPPEKSLFKKPVGIGGAIGFLCWQNAMGMYINDVTKWLQSFDFMRVVVFVDDIYVVTRDKARFLSMMPELRCRLAELGVKLNEKKFYCQHYSKGVMILGTMMKFGRLYCNNRTYSRCLETVNKMASWRKRCLSPQNVLCSLNSYVGSIKNRNQNKRLEKLISVAKKSIGNLVEWNPKKRCFALLEKFKFANSLTKFYTNNQRRAKCLN